MMPSARSAVEESSFPLDLENSQSDRGPIDWPDHATLPHLRNLLALEQAIKKLPQAGQEPVEAVESRRICPDALHGSREVLGRQR
jgi:hypothetical protein